MSLKVLSFKTYEKTKMEQTKFKQKFNFRLALFNELTTCLIYVCKEKRKRRINFGSTENGHYQNLFLKNANFLFFQDALLECSKRNTKPL